MILKTLKFPSMDENTYILTDENTKKTFIVDPSADINIISSYVEEMDLKLEYIILTHGHADHIMTVKKLMEKYDNVKLLAHKDEKNLLNTPSINLSNMFGSGKISLDADIYVSDGQTLEIGDMKLEFIHTPGHTKGSMCILVDKKVLLSGDTLFYGSIGRTDFPGGSYEEMAKSLKKLKTLDDDIKVYSGHGIQTILGEEKKHNMFMRQV